MQGEGGMNMDERLGEKLQVLSVHERRCDMLYRLPTLIEFKIKDLCELYHVSRTSIVRDLDFLEEHFGMEMERVPGRYGGIYVRYGWKPPGGFYMTLNEFELMLEIKTYVPANLQEQLDEFIEHHAGKRK